MLPAISAPPPARPSPSTPRSERRRGDHRDRHDTGTAGDFITSDTTLTVSGTNGALGAGEKMQVSSDGGTTWSDVTQDATTWSFADPTSHASSFTYQARVVDAAGNVGNTDSQAVTIDTTAPSGGRGDHRDRRRHRHGRRLHHQRHHADGVRHQRRARRRREDAGQQRRRNDLDGRTTSDATTWSLADTAPATASFTYQARVIDAAANVGNTDSQAVTIDTSNPTAALDITAIADDTGTAGDFITSDTTLTVSGTNGALGAGEKVQVSSDGGTTWTDVAQNGTTWSLVDPTSHRRASPTRRG